MKKSASEAVGDSGHRRCPSHQREYMEIYKQYKNSGTSYLSLEVSEDESDTDLIEEKVAREEKQSS